MHWPGIAPWLVNDFVRGAVTGLGVVNIVAGIADLLPMFARRTLVRRSAEREGG